MRAVVVAAGNGTRLRPLTMDVPKPLISLCGRPLLVHVLGALASSSVEETIVVTGYLGKRLQENLRLWESYFAGTFVRFVHNYEYDRGNGISLLKSRKYIRDQEIFLLLMSDHIVEPRIIGSFLRNMVADTSLAVDRRPRFKPQMRDATKVLVNKNNSIIDIGKDLLKWNGIDTGVFLCMPVVFDALRVIANQRYNVSITDAMNWLIRTGRAFRAIDVSGSFWLDVDTVEDLDFAERILCGGDVESATRMGWDCIPVYQP
nr:NTP transferase domain-containing protein [Candidatus Njordarchaeota archaeon]